MKARPVIDVRSTALGKEVNDTPVGYSGRLSLKRK
jgi:hypothetical protein